MNEESNSSRKSPRALVEAALFISSEPVPKTELLSLTGLSEGELDQLLEDLESEVKMESRGFTLTERNQNYQFKVKRDLLPRVKYLAPHQDIPKGVLRTLSVIAYNSPVLQKEVINIRGNGAYDHIDELVDRGFVATEQEGRTQLLSVTQDFLNYFDLDSTEELRKSGALSG